LFFQIINGYPKDSECSVVRVHNKKVAAFNFIVTFGKGMFVLIYLAQDSEIRRFDKMGQFCDGFWRLPDNIRRNKTGNICII